MIYILWFNSFHFDFIKYFEFFCLFNINSFIFIIPIAIHFIISNIFNDIDIVVIEHNLNLLISFVSKKSQILKIVVMVNDQNNDHYFPFLLVLYFQFYEVKIVIYGEYF